jgi:hypothetical protein
LYGLRLDRRRLESADQHELLELWRKLRTDRETNLNLLDARELARFEVLIGKGAGDRRAERACASSSQSGARNVRRTRSASARHPGRIP